jgi:hypothetical protein
MVREIETKKYYPALGEWGTNFYHALMSDRHNNHRLIDDWISEQSDAYLSKDYDCDRIPDIIWSMREVNLIRFFERNKIDIGSIDRDDIDKWIKELSTKVRLKDKDSLALVSRLKEAFEKDLNGKREEWAYERASEDFDMEFGDIRADLANDEEVAQFFGVSSEFTDVKDFRGDEYKKEYVCFCPYCNEAMAEENQQDIQHMIDEDNDFDESVFGCESCMDIRSRANLAFIEANKHLPEAKLVAWRI